MAEPQPNGWRAVFTYNRGNDRGFRWEWRVMSAHADPPCVAFGSNTFLWSARRAVRRALIGLVIEEVRRA